MTLFAIKLFVQSRKHPLRCLGTIKFRTVYRFLHLFIVYLLHCIYTGKRKMTAGCAGPSLLRIWSIASPPTNGRAPSWIRSFSDLEDIWEIPLMTESTRVFPPCPHLIGMACLNSERICWNWLFQYLSQQWRFHLVVYCLNILKVYQIKGCPCISISSLFIEPPIRVPSPAATKIRLFIISTL